MLHNCTARKDFERTVKNTSFSLFPVTSHITQGYCLKALFHKYIVKTALGSTSVKSLTEFSLLHLHEPEFFSFCPDTTLKIKSSCLQKWEKKILYQWIKTIFYQVSAQIPIHLYMASNMQDQTQMMYFHLIGANELERLPNKTTLQLQSVLKWVRPLKHGYWREMTIEQGDHLYSHHQSITPNSLAWSTHRSLVLNYKCCKQLQKILK